MSRLLIGTMGLIVIMALMVTSIRLIGDHNRPPEARIFDPGDCVQPCWHDIQPGKTTLKDAETILRADTHLIRNLESKDALLGCELSWDMPAIAPYEGCIFDQNGIVTVIEIFIRTPAHDVGIQLGYVLPVVGSPTAFQMCSGASRIAGLTFLSDDVEVFIELISKFALELPTPDGNLDPQLVRAVYYKQPGSKPFDDYRRDTPRWRGFEKLPLGYSSSQYYEGSC